MTQTTQNPPKDRPRRHTLPEDAQGLLFGTGMAATGLVILTHLGLVTGQTAGLRFTIKTFVSVALLSVLSMVLPDLMTFQSLNPAYGAILFGAITGAGLLALFRHGASLGGVGILALYLQEKTGFRAGFTQLIFDACIFTAAFFVIETTAVLYSLLGAVVVNLIITLNHRRDWYVAT